jgi:formylglycine-generating enzyme required for sulfatase activity
VISLLACAPEQEPVTTIPSLDYQTDNVDMVAIEAGEFDMGPDDFDDAHHVTLTHPFWMARYETRQDAWTGLIEENPSLFTDCAECPVERTSWIAAALYANAVSADEGLEACYLEDGTELTGTYVADPYACDGYRLPTEAEWEYAARAGRDGVYAGSDTIEGVAWYLANAEKTTHPVGQLAPNAWGLYDMAGNVWEWTSDHYRFFSEDEVDPFAPTDDPYRVNRGGGWNGEENVCHVTYRGARGSDFYNENLGFRLARSRP